MTERLIDWLYATTPCPSCGGPNAPERFEGDVVKVGDAVSVSVPYVTKGRECEKCFKLRAFARCLRRCIATKKMREA